MLSSRVICIRFKMTLKGFRCKTTAVELGLYILAIYYQWCRRKFWSAGVPQEKILNDLFWCFPKISRFILCEILNDLFGPLQISARTLNTKLSGWFDNKYRNARSGQISSTGTYKVPEHRSGPFQLVYTPVYYHMVTCYLKMQTLLGVLDRLPLWGTFV